MTTSPDEQLRQREFEIYLRWMKGDRDAARFIEQFFYLCHLWDDLIDRDVPRSNEQINAAFWVALVSIPENPFYMRHWAELHPVVVASINDWHAANTIEDARKRLDISYTLRCSILTVISHCAYLCGGRDWAHEVGPEIRLMGQRETLEEYKEKLNA